MARGQRPRLGRDLPARLREPRRQDPRGPDRVDERRAGRRRRHRAVARAHAQAEGRGIRDPLSPRGAASGVRASTSVGLGREQPGEPGPPPPAEACAARSHDVRRRACGARRGARASIQRPGPRYALPRSRGSVEPRSPPCSGPTSGATSSRSTAARVRSAAAMSRTSTTCRRRPRTPAPSHSTTRQSRTSCSCEPRARSCRRTCSPIRPIRRIPIGSVGGGRVPRELSGIDRKWRLHDLRHWTATTAITSGHDVRTVAGRLGHANPAMTLRVYAYAVEGADQALAETLAAALDGASAK